jgi:hypothetical protein
MNDKTTIVYAASHGEYSDYCVARLFRSEEAAKKFVAEKTKDATQKCLQCDGRGFMYEPTGKHRECFYCYGKGIVDCERWFLEEFELEEEA